MYIANKTASKSLRSFDDWAAVQLDAPEWRVATKTTTKKTRTILFQYLLTVEICKYRTSQGLRQTETDMFEGSFSVHILSTYCSMEP